MEWNNAKHILPEHLPKNWIYSIEVEFKTKNDTVYIGWYRFDFQEWILKDKHIDGLGVTQWRRLTV